MLKKDLDNRYLTFRIPKDIRNTPVKFVLYNETEKTFPIISTMYNREDKIMIDTLSLNEHYNYKYKFQILKNGKWITSKPYKYINVSFKTVNNVQYKFYREVDSKYLLVCFSGNGKSPTYNYIGAFSSLKVNKLFIKDDFTSKTSNNSVFYIGTNQENEVMEYISELIDEIRGSINVTKENIICCGTSKGGYASILYALTYGYGYCVTGSPTLYLGNSLLIEGNQKDHARVISGGVDKLNVDWLNNVLISKIDNANKCNISIIIGTGERRYIKHVKPFINDSKSNPNLSFNIKKEDFEEHNKVATVYPPYARDVIKSIITPSN